jgi:hypothetical protein
VGRNILERQEGHLTPESLSINGKIKMGEISKSKTAEYSWDEDYRIQWNKAEIIHKKENRITMKLKVLVSIRTAKQVISQSGLDVISIWLPLLWDKK